MKKIFSTAPIYSKEVYDIKSAETCLNDHHMGDCLLDQSKHYTVLRKSSLIRAQNSDLNQCLDLLKPETDPSLMVAILQCRFNYLCGIRLFGH